jgi:hypothetical protein
LLQGHGGTVPVRPVVCFPWSEPDSYISLDHSSRQALETTLRQTRFVFEVIAINNIEDEFELRTWLVETRQGPRSFQTKLDKWPRALENGAVIIRDVSGDFYQISDPMAMDPASRKLVWAFME